MVGGILGREACVVEGCAYMTEGHACQVGVHGRRDGHCSGWYASYWNAFLFKMLTLKLAQ